MILSKSVLVKSSSFYEKLGYDICEKYIYVDIVHLSRGSSAIILAKCDYCGSEKEISYKNYNRNILNGSKFSCSVKCGVLKSKETNLLKWGVDSVNKLESKKNKIKDTIYKKYGTDHISKVQSVRESKRVKMISKSEDISNRMSQYWDNLSPDEISKINSKRENTNLEKWGIKYISQLQQVKNKIKKTNLEKWGGYTYQSDILMNKVISTNLIKYGKTHSSSSDIIKEKVRKTNLDKWGYEYASMSPIIKDKIKRTNLEKWGVENIMFLPEVVKELNSKFYEKWGVNTYFKTDEFKNSVNYNPVGNEIFRKDLLISNHQNYIRYVGGFESEFNCDCGKEHTFLISSINFHNRIKNNLPLCTVCNPIGDSQSIKEGELFNCIKSIYNGQIIQSYRDGMEIDIYLPELKIGFEFNGLYWHSDLHKDKRYHLNKTNWFKERGIRIIHIWEDDWIYKGEIIKSQIRNWLGLTDRRIFARDCQVKVINDSKIVTEFLERNHIQGKVNSKIKIGLYHNEELVSVMTFDQFEGRKRMEPGGWNLSRFCNKLNYNVVGGASKLLKYFISEWKPSRIVSYADRDWSNGELYYKLGFNLVGESGPDYKYIIDGRRFNKQKLTKSKLNKIGFNLEKSENQITKELGILKIYNVGQLKFELIINSE